MKRLQMLKLRAWVSDEAGAVAITTAVLLVMFLGLAAIAVDVGHLAMVKSELQRTADASALAGAMGLAPYTGSWSNPTPNWLQGQAQARGIIENAANQADAQTFTAGEGTVSYGYWCLRPPAGYVQPPLPITRPTTAAYLPEPAIQVTLSRNVALSFAPLVGITSPQVVVASAIAILPEAYSVRNLPPVAVSEQTVYNNVNGVIELDVSLQNIKPQSNKGEAGWFNLTGQNNVPSVRYSQPLTASTTSIYLVPGTDATLTSLISAGETVVLPVVANIYQSTWRTINSFAAFQVTSVGSSSMTGCFVAKFLDPSVTPAPYTSTFSPVWGTPRLVK